MKRDDAKLCAYCARRFEWRRKWAECWDEVRYCSDACRRGARNPRTRAIEAELRRLMLELLEARGSQSSICPSEVARAFFAEDAWRAQMESVRRVARRLVAEGLAEILQRGRVVDASSARGPIRVRAARS